LKTAEAVALFIQSRQAKNLSEMTVKWYREILVRFSRDFKRVPKKPEEIEKFIIKLRVGDERRHGYYRALKCFYHFLEKRKLSKNPLKYVDEPRTSLKDPAVLIPTEINHVLYSTHHPKVKAALLFLTDTGPRLAEVAGLTPDKLIETPEGFIAIVKGKTGTRAVPISYESYHALMINLPFGWSKDWLGRRISQACRDAGVKASALTFRHTFGTLWSGDELILQQIMGHTTLLTTRRYRHLRTRALIEQHNQYSPLKMVFSMSKAML